VLRGAGSREHEQLLELELWLVRTAAAAGPVPPAMCAPLVAEAMTSFPANPCFLAAVAGGAATEARGGARGGGWVGLSRLAARRLLAAGCKRHAECPSLWRAAVRFETATDADDGAESAAVSAAATTRCSSRAESSRGGRCGGCFVSSNSVAPDLGAYRRAKSTLEQALRPAACGGTPALWREYVALELAHGRGGAACRVVLRAVQQCPGSKELWCAVLSTPLVQIAPPSQISDTLQLLAEKELRLRHEPPERLEEEEGGAESRAGDAARDFTGTGAGAEAGRVREAGAEAAASRASAESYGSGSGSGQAGPESEGSSEGRSDSSSDSEEGSSGGSQDEQASSDN
jgi:hypothetical protein